MNDAGAGAALDPVTVEVIGSALESIVEEMGEALIRASYSTNIKERRDASTALFDAAGRTLCQAEHIPIHLGSFIELLPEIMKRHPVEGMRPGDVFVGNDAYTGGGTHLPDIVLAEPIFIDGQIRAWAVNLAHHADFVDRGHLHIFQEGLRIPPVRLYRAGELVPDILEMILTNCQVPDERRADLAAQMAANRLGVLRFASLVGRYGWPTVEAATRALMDYAERKMRAGILAIPDGTYRFADRFDGPELQGVVPGAELEFACEIVVAGDTMRLHFDSPPQVRAGLNVTMTALLATVYYAVKTLVDPTILPNAGLARPITVTAPSGTVLNCSHPAAVNGRINTCQRVVDLIHGALAPAIPDRVTAAHNGACVSATFAGHHPGTGKYWVYLETIGGGFGARATKDGLDGVHVHTTNTSNLPVEALETEYPLVVERYELVDGSAGPGRFRGGMGLRRVVRAEGAGCVVRIDGTRELSSPWGLFGGGDGGRYEARYSEGVAPPVKGVTWLAPGQVAAVVTPGAGGYGPPADRPPAQVARDVAEGRVSRELARDVYGHDSDKPGSAT
jgi:N-methylhydantoinase B